MSVEEKIVEILEELPYLSTDERTALRAQIHMVADIARVEAYDQAIAIITGKESGPTTEAEKEQFMLDRASEAVEYN